MNRTRALLIPALLAIALTPGCSVKLPKQAVNEVPRSQFRLELPPAPPIASAASGVLLVRPVDVAPGFSSPAFVRRDDKGVYTADPYNRFLATPADDIHAAMTGWLRQKDIFRAVITEYSSVRPTHFLETSVEELYGTTTPSGGNIAVLRIRFLLHQRRTGGETIVLFDRTFEKSVPTPTLRGADLKAGWEQALAEAMEDLAGEMRSRGWSQSAE
jgi:hypothetical protein